MEGTTLSEVSGLFRHIAAALLTAVVLYFSFRQLMTSVERLFGWTPPGKRPDEVLLKCLDTIAEETALLANASDDDDDSGWSTEDSDCVTVVEVPGLTTPHLLQRTPPEDRNNNKNEWPNVTCHGDAHNNKKGNHGDAQARRNKAPEEENKAEEVGNGTAKEDKSGSWDGSRRQMQTTTSLTWEPTGEGGPLAVRVHTTMSGNVRPGGELEGRTEVLVDFGKSVATNGEAHRPEEGSKSTEQLGRVDADRNADAERGGVANDRNVIPHENNSRCSGEVSASGGITSDERLRGLLERASQRRTYAVADNIPTIVPTTSESEERQQVSSSIDGMPRAPKLDGPPAPRDDEFSAHVTARAVAAEQPRNVSSEGIKAQQVRSVASARVSSRSDDNPILALACATAQATSAACADASWELLSRSDWPETDTDISLVVSTACTVPVSGAWTARHRRSRSEPDLRRDLVPPSARSPGGIRQRHASSGDYSRPPSRLRNRPVPEFRDPAFPFLARRRDAMKDLQDDNLTSEPLADGIRTVQVREVEATPYPRSPIFARTGDVLQLGPPPPRRSDRPSTPGSPPSILRTPSPMPSPTKTPEPPPLPPLPPRRLTKVKRSPPISAKPNGHHQHTAEDPQVLTERITGYRAASKLTTKPPLPPPCHSVRMTSGVKNRIAGARLKYLESQQQAKAAQLADERFADFCRRTREERERLSSSPDLSAQIPPSPPVRRRAIDRPAVPPPSSRSSARPVPPSRPWPSDLTRTLLSQQQKRLSRSLGFLETDIDTLQSRQVYETDLDGMLPPDTPPPPPAAMEDRSRSVDFLLDEDSAPPENRLANGGRVKSEHELRIERSLQNLHIPDWYKKAEVARRGKEGFLLSRRDSSSSQERWTGLGSRTPSYSSLKDGGPTPGLVIPKRVTRPFVSSLRSSRESLPSPGVETLSRWSSSRLSTSSAPVSTWTVYRSFQRPYLGWRAAAASSGQTPSPSPSTPMSLSRPVSPGKSLHLYQPSSDYEEPRKTPERLAPKVSQSPKKSEEEEEKMPNGQAVQIPRDRYSYLQSLYNPDAKLKLEEHPVISSSKSSSQILWVESSFVGSRSTTSVAVMPDEDPLKRAPNGDLSPPPDKIGRSKLPDCCRALRRQKS